MSTKKAVSAARPAGNKRLAARAEKVVRESGTDSRPGMCQRAARETIQQEYGARYNKYHGETALISARRWQKSPYAIDPARGSLVGDILYQMESAHDPRGHVGIRLPGNKVAENGSRKKGRIRGGYGIVSLEDFGKVDLIVRLPENP